MRGTQETPETIKLLGDTLCLNFTNSVDWSDDGRPLPSETDALLHPADLGRWAVRMGLAAPGHAPAADAAELHAARELRGEVREVFSAIARAETPPAAALGQLARTYGEAAASAHLAAAGGGWHMHWPPGESRRVRFAVAADAIDLLADARRLARVRVCPGRDCGWLFLDASGRRRWCSMQTCGSRAKMRRLYERRRPPASG